MTSHPAPDVDTYIARAASEARPKLQEIRRIIRSTLPHAEEKISWGVPFYTYHGPVAGFAVYTRHVSFGLSLVLRQDDREALEAAGYTTGKKTVQIRFDQRAPATAIRRILRAQAKANEARGAAKAK